MTDRELRRLLRELPEETVGDRFTSGVLARLGERKPTAPAWRWGLAPGLGALMLAALAMALVVERSAPRQDRQARAFEAPLAPEPRANERAVARPAADDPPAAASRGEAPDIAPPPPAPRAQPVSEPIARPAARRMTVGAPALGRERRLAHLERLLDEQRELSRELGELRRGLVEKPMLYVADNDGAGLLLPLETAPERGMAPGARSPGARPAVRVVPARSRTY